MQFRFRAHFTLRQISFTLAMLRGFRTVKRVIYYYFMAPLYFQDKKKNPSITKNRSPMYRSAQFRVNNPVEMCLLKDSKSRKRNATIHLMFPNTFGFFCLQACPGQICWLLSWDFSFAGKGKPFPPLLGSCNVFLSLGSALWELKPQAGERCPSRTQHSVRSHVDDKLIARTDAPWAEQAGCSCLYTPGDEQLTQRSTFVCWQVHRELVNFPTENTGKALLCSITCTDLVIRSWSSPWLTPSHPMWHQSLQNSSHVAPSIPRPGTPAPCSRAILYPCKDGTCFTSQEDAEHVLSLIYEAVMLQARFQSASL